MKKYEYLQSSTKVKHEFISFKNQFAYWSRCKDIFFLRDPKKYFNNYQEIPNRHIHPNLYHWFILMKQFSTRTLEIWQQESMNLSDDDRLIDQFIIYDSTNSPKENQPLLPKDRIISLKRIDSYEKAQAVTTPNKSSKKLLNLELEESSGGQQSRENNINYPISKLTHVEHCSGTLQRQKVEANPSTVEIECVMEMQLKAEENTPIREFKQRLTDQKLKLVSLQGEQEKIRVVFKADLEDLQRLKDRISQWEQISNVQFRKQKKLTCKMEIKSEKLLSPEKSLNNFVN